MANVIKEKTLMQQYEPAARIYCEKMGVKPDAKVKVPHPGGLQALVEIPQWHLFAEELIDFSMKLTSLKEAAQETMHERRSGIIT